MKAPHGPTSTPPPVIDYNEAEYYLQTLIGPEWRTTSLVFQTFDDNADRQKKQAERAKLNGQRSRKDPYAKVHVGLWDQQKDRLATINNNGGGVFITVNHTEGGRSIDKLQYIRAIWCEWDNPEPLPDWPLTPHIVVESSPQKYHIYWLADDLSANDHHRLMQVMVAKWKSDPNAADVVRVLRLPGFLHRKVDTDKGLRGLAWKVRVLSADDRLVSPPYTLPQLIKGFKVEEYEEEQKTQEKEQSRSSQDYGSRRTLPIDILEIRDALKFIPPEERATWLKIGMALASTRNKGAFQLWDEWSRSSDKYDEQDQYRTWESFRENKRPDVDSGVTLGTLYKIAKEAGWDRESGWTKGLITTQQGNPISCPANICLILRHTPLWSDHLRFNSFTGQAEYGEPQFDEFGRGSGAHAWGDTDDARLADFLRQEYRMAVMHLGHCTQAVDHVARDHSYDPITTWLDSLIKWDGIDRLSYFFNAFCEVVHTPYTAFCGRSLFISLVARAYQPGCQVDTVVILESKEGARKTGLCRIVGGPWYKALQTSFEGKDIYGALKRAWIAELAELDAFSRAGQGRIKSLLTSLADNYRPAYGRHEVEQLRRTVFIGTTNDPVYIVDPYGARRFFPMKVGKIDLGSVREFLPQLFAEAIVAYQAGEPWWTDDPEILNEANEARESVRESDPWESALKEYLKKDQEEVMLTDIFGVACLNVPTERQTRAMQTRIGIILKTLGYVKKRRCATKTEDSPTNPREYYYTKEEVGRG